MLDLVWPLLENFRRFNSPKLCEEEINEDDIVEDGDALQSYLLVKDMNTCSNLLSKFIYLFSVCHYNVAHNRYIKIIN